jgi:hypothetical protein
MSDQEKGYLLSDQETDDESQGEDLYCRDCSDALFGWERKVCDQCRIRTLEGLLRRFVKLNLYDTRPDVLELVAGSIQALKR